MRRWHGNNVGPGSGLDAYRGRLGGPGDRQVRGRVPLDALDQLDNGPGRHREPPSGAGPTSGGELQLPSRRQERKPDLGFAHRKPSAGRRHRLGGRAIRRQVRSPPCRPFSFFCLLFLNDPLTPLLVARYLELDEIGKGRFAVVRRARDRGTGQEVALKQTPRQKQSRSLTRAEYDLLASTHHGNIVRAFALFENAPQLGVDTIVLEL
jgi:hypothetical protein